MTTKFQTKYKHDRPSFIKFEKPSLTDQQFAFESNINNLVNGYILPSADVGTPQFNQTFDVEQYKNAINIVAEAKSEFYKLSPLVRREFDNNPEKLVAFMNSTDEADIKKGVKLGLYKKEALDIFKKSDIVTPTNPTAPETSTAIDSKVAQ